MPRRQMRLVALRQVYTGCLRTGTGKERSMMGRQAGASSGQGFLYSLLQGSVHPHDPKDGLSAKREPGRESGESPAYTCRALCRLAARCRTRAAKRLMRPAAAIRATCCCPTPANRDKKARFPGRGQKSELLDVICKPVSAKVSIRRCR